MSMTADAFKKLVTQLQNHTFTDAWEAYGEKGFERWRSKLYRRPSIII